MVGTQPSNDDDVSAAGYHAFAERYHRAAVHKYRLGHHEEAQRLAAFARANRAKAHVCFLSESQTPVVAEEVDQIRTASKS